MKTYVLKETSAFQNDEKPYYGYAGDHYICALVEAESEDQAWETVLTGMGQWTDTKREHWTIEEYVPTGKPVVHLLAYGDY